MPNVTRYATQGEVGIWIEKSIEERGQSVSKNSQDVVAQKPTMIHFDESGAQEHEGQPTPAQVKLFNTAFQSALLEAVSKLPGDAALQSGSISIHLLMPVNHKLKKSIVGRMLGGMLGESAHWTGVAMDFTLAPEELIKLRESQAREGEISGKLKLLDKDSENLEKLNKMLRNKDPMKPVTKVDLKGQLSNVLNALDPSALEKLKTDNSGDKEFIKLIDLAQEKKKLEDSLKTPGWFTEDERKGMQEKLKEINEGMQALDQQLLDAGKSSVGPIEYIFLLNKLPVGKLEQQKKEEMGALRQQLDQQKKQTESELESVSKLAKGRSELAHYDSWGGQDKRDRYHKQLEGVLTGAGFEKSLASKECYAQRPLTTTCGDHTAINLAKHVGCKTIFGKSIDEVDKPNSDSTIRATSDQAVETAVQEMSISPDPDLATQAMLFREERQELERGMGAFLKHYFGGSFLDTLWAGANAVKGFINTLLEGTASSTKESSRLPEGEGNILTDNATSEHNSFIHDVAERFRKSLSSFSNLRTAAVDSLKSEGTGVASPTQHVDTANPPMISSKPEGTTPTTRVEVPSPSEQPKVTPGKADELLGTLTEGVEEDPLVKPDTRKLR